MSRYGKLQSDHDALVVLNQDYVRSVQNCDVARFTEILAADFVCTNADGSLLDRSAFLEQSGRPIAIRDLTAHDVRVRILGDVAIIHARTSYSLPNGGQGSGRYTDVWQRQDGAWRAVAAHVTRS